MTGAALTSEELLAEEEGRKKKVDHVNFYDPELWADLEHARRGEAQRKKVESFFRLLAVCHSVIPEKNENTGEIKFSASSPDDEALVCTARYFGYAFEGRRDGSALVRNTRRNVLESFRVLEILEFTSARKRMSVIVESVEDGKILVLAKGADTAMGPRLKPGQGALLDSTLEHMKRFASEGLRTLMVCCATLTKEAFGR
ncbi:p-type atpase (p-atpase) superfamily [Nannochloropsis gaditana]|uniref:P-type atpase (P-atpase) superfamily n=1 Tax=Nannochloropsis gaditana TaxID=72520 RepID=W7TIJ0_9STRA|nr:p-type atpase (p-atpase) superfamily [Nannochloropsis gaditana]